MSYEMLLSTRKANKMDAMMYRVVNGMSKKVNVYVRAGMDYVDDAFYATTGKGMTRMEVVNAYVMATMN